MRKEELILSLLVTLSMVCLAAVYTKADSTFRVHLINAKSGSPIADSPVRLWTHAPAERRNDPGFVQELTDSNGVATFDVKDPVPTYLYIHAGMGSPWKECSPDAQNGFVTQEILQSGVSEESPCWKLPDISRKFHAVPGDVYIFVVHDTLIERLKALGH